MEDRKKMSGKKKLDKAAQKARMKRRIWISSIIPLIITAIVLQFMPDMVPAHYDTSGVVDRWGSKNEQFIFPVIIILLSLGWMIYIRYYEKKIDTAKDMKEKAMITSNAETLHWVVFIQNILFGVQQCCIMLQAYREANKETTGEIMFSTDNMIMLAFGVFVILISNFLTKTKKNYVIGLRTKWSMYNDNTWRRSNFGAAVCLIVAGLFTVITSVVVKDVFLVKVIPMGYLMAALLISVVYSFRVYNEEKEKEQTEQNTKVVEEAKQ